MFAVKVITKYWTKHQLGAGTTGLMTLKSDYAADLLCVALENIQISNTVYKIQTVLSLNF